MVILGIAPLVFCAILYAYACFSPHEIDPTGTVSSDMALCFHFNDVMHGETIRTLAGVFKLVEVVGILYFMLRVTMTDQALLAETAAQIILAVMSMLAIMHPSSRAGLTFTKFLDVVDQTKEEAKKREAAGGEGKDSYQEYKPPSSWRTLMHASQVWKQSSKAASRS